MNVFSVSWLYVLQPILCKGVNRQSYEVNVQTRSPPTWIGWPLHTQTHTHKLTHTHTPTVLWSNKIFLHTFKFFGFIQIVIIDNIFLSSFNIILNQCLKQFWPRKNTLLVMENIPTQAPLSLWRGAVHIGVNRFMQNRGTLWCTQLYSQESQKGIM